MRWQVPVVLNAIGGILVGLITQLAGGVKKVCPEICSERSMSFQGILLNCNAIRLFCACSLKWMPLNCGIKC